MEQTITKKRAESTGKSDLVKAVTNSGKTQQNKATDTATSKKKTASGNVKKASASNSKTPRAQKSGEAVLNSAIQPVSCTDYADSTPQKKQVAVIVGASSGIGYHTALTLCKEGFTVYNLSRSDAEPHFIQTIRADVCKPHEIAEAIETIFEREGHIDALIYSAGWSLACPLEHVSEDDFRKVFEVNYFGLIKTLWAVIPIMRLQGEGRIVAISSLAGTTPIPFDAPYSASKAAIDITLRSLAIELHPYNIKITSIQPGGVHTRFTFKRKVYEPEHIGGYTEALQKAVAKLDQAEQNGMDPRTVAAFVANILTDKRPPLTTPVGLKDCATRMVQKLLPPSLTDYLDRIAWE